MNIFNDIQAVKNYVRENVDLSKIIEEDAGITWREESSGVFVCCSPFRDESNPSFKLKGDKFKDWGGEQHSGDVFSWIQLWHNVSFYEAIEYAADKAGLDISQYKRDPTPQELQRNRYIKINNEAASYMHDLLRQNTVVRDDYFARSGFNLAQIEPYQVGYCPSSELLVNHLSHKFHISQDDIGKLEFYRKDLFDNAIIYPVHDHRGDVLFFYTRQFAEGSPYKGMRAEHPLHTKSILYGFHVVRKNLRKDNNTVIVVEGQRDTIAIGAAGCLTSSISDDQIKILLDHKVKTIIACYDGDYTGWTKSLEMVNKPPVVGDAVIKISRPEMDMDPHDMWLKYRDNTKDKIIQQAEIPLEHYVRTRFGGVGGELSLTEKHTLLIEIKEFLIQISGVQLHMAATYLADVLGTTKEAIMDHVAGIKADYSELYNTEAERTLIYYCMTQPASLSATRSAGVDYDSFTISQYKKLYEATIITKDKFQEGYTPQAILDEAMARWPMQELVEIYNLVMEGDHKYTADVACEIVLDMWRRRIASEQANKLLSATQDLATTFVEIVNTHRKELITVTATTTKQARTPKELADEFRDELRERHESGGNIIIGHSIDCLPSVNAILGGVQGGHATILSGDSGAGKSMVAMNIAKSIAIDHKQPMLWIGQEMHSKENIMRLVSIMTGLDNTRLQSGNLNKKEVELAMDAYHTIANSSLYMAKPTYGHIDEILSITEEYMWRYGINTVIWDYIQLVTTGPGQERWNREQVIGHASTLMKNRVAGDMGMALIMIAQLNRDPNSSGKHKIAGSYRIIQDCDNHVYISEKTKKQMADDGEGKGNRYATIDKRRGGMCGIRVHAKLDIDPGQASLRVFDCSPPSDISKLYA